MRTFYLTIATAAMALISIASTEAFSQKQPIVQGTNLKPGGVSSRNMELLDVVNIHPEWHDQFETIAVTYPGGGSPVTRNFIIATTEEGSGDDKKGVIRLLDVTNPRSMKSDFLKIYSKGDMPPFVGPPCNVSHYAANLKMVGCIDSGAGGRYPRLLCGRLVL